MRFAFSLTLLALLSFAQDQNYVYDSDGRKVALPSFSEERKSRLVEDGPNGKIVEETVVRKDAQGNPMPAQRIRNIERTGPSGESIRETIVYEADMNGRMALQEKSTVRTARDGARTVIETLVEKPNGNGGLQLFEKVAAQKQLENGKETETRSIYRPDATGRLAENSREAIERETKNGRAEETVRIYESVSTGRPILSRQKQIVSLQNPDGSTSNVVTIYGVDAPGRPAGGALKVREQQILTTRPGQGDTLVESLSIRRPDLADGRLGKEEKVGERVLPKQKP